MRTESEQGPLFSLSLALSRDPNPKTERCNLLIGVLNYTHVAYSAKAGDCTNSDYF